MSSDAPAVTYIPDAREYSTETLALLRAAGELLLGDVPEAQRATVTAVFVELGTYVDEAFLDNFPRLRFLVTPTTGVTHIDLGATKVRGVEVVALRRNAPELADVSATAELTWGLLLNLTRRISLAGQSVVAGQWQRQQFRGVELRGRTLGIVGLGRLGRHVARYGHTFGMRVVAHDIDPAAFDRVDVRVARATAEQLLDWADVVSLHLPYESGDGPWLDDERVRMMRPGAVLINTSRGELIDEGAVAQAVRDGHLDGVGLDVLVDDSSWATHVQKGNPLVALATEGANVVITPHVGGYARPALQEARHLIALDYLSRTSRSQLVGSEVQKRV